MNNNQKRSNQANARQRWGRKARHGNPMCLASLKDREEAACLSDSVTRFLFRNPEA